MERTAYKTEFSSPKRFVPLEKKISMFIRTVTRGLILSDIDPSVRFLLEEKERDTHLSFSPPFLISISLFITRYRIALTRSDHKKLGSIERNNLKGPIGNNQQRRGPFALSIKQKPTTGKEKVAQKVALCKNCQYLAKSKLMFFSEC